MVGLLPCGVSVDVISDHENPATENDVALVVAGLALFKQYLVLLYFFELCPVKKLFYNLVLALLAQYSVHNLFVKWHVFAKLNQHLL